MYGWFFKRDRVDRTRFGVEAADRIFFRILDRYFPAVSFAVDRQNIRCVAAGRDCQAVGVMDGFDMITSYVEGEFLTVADEVAVCCSSLLCQSVFSR